MMVSQEDCLPMVVVAGSSSEDQDSFFKDLLKKFKSVESSSSYDGAYHIEIFTKYYSACAVLSLDTSGNVGDGSAEALIYFINNLNSDTISGVKTVLEKSQMPVKILACRSVEEELFEQVMKICIDTDVEIVDLSAENDDNEYPEKHGIDRIVEILETHSWPNRTDPVKQSGAKTPENPEPVPFEEMFAKFAEMKATAERLPPSERKAFAESVVTAFWKAVGGPDGELFDSDDEH